MGELGENIMIRGHQLQLPFTNQIKKAKVVILDTESIQNKITVLGYYRVGDSVINCILFEQPTEPLEILKVPFFRQLFSENKIAIYNAKWEQELFGFSDAQIIELMEYPFSAKEEYISLQSLDKINSKSLPGEWNKDAYFQFLFHNYSCVVKEVLLYIGQGCYSTHNIKSQMKDWFNNIELFFNTGISKQNILTKITPELYEQLAESEKFDKEEGEIA